MTRAERKRRTAIRLVLRVVLFAALAVAVVFTVKSFGELKKAAPDSGSATGQTTAGTGKNPGSDARPQTQNGGGAQTDPGVQTGTGTGTGTGTQPQDPRAGYIICIDPGHGYADPGCLCDLEGSEGLQEKQITLEISLRLRDTLEEMGYAVIMTREDDVYPDWLRAQREAENPKALEKMPIGPRVQIANDAPAALFVSIHVDKAANAKAHGVRMYYYTGNTSTTADYAKMLSAGVNDVLMEQVQVTGMSLEDSFGVNREVTMPSVLIEVGFFSNADDTARMQDEIWQQNLARGIADGIEKYYQKYGAANG